MAIGPLVLPKFTQSLNPKPLQVMNCIACLKDLRYIGNVLLIYRLVEQLTAQP